MSTDNNSKGILLIIAAMTLFAMQDSLIKFIFEKAALMRFFLEGILLQQFYFLDTSNSEAKKFH